MKRLGKNQGGYFGETINLVEFLAQVEQAAKAHGWQSEDFLRVGSLRLFALNRPASSEGSPEPVHVYISTGIHGDEPAGPLAMLQLLRANQWPPNCSFWLCPCLNPAGFYLNQRENQKGADQGDIGPSGRKTTVGYQVKEKQHDGRPEICDDRTKKDQGWVGYHPKFRVA